MEHWERHTQLLVVLTKRIKEGMYKEGFVQFQTTEEDKGKILRQLLTIRETY